MKLMNAAIVFNCSYNGWSVIKDLARNGVKEIYALDFERSVGTYSKYAEYIKCPNPLTEELEFIDFLLEFGKRKGNKPVLFPTNDHWVQALAHHKDRLQEVFHLWVPESSVIDLIIYKNKFYEWASKKGYPVPATWSFNQICQIAATEFPVAIKPAYRNASSNDKNQATKASLKYQERLIVLNSSKEIESLDPDFEKSHPDYIVQQYVRGLSDCMYTVGVYVNGDHEVMGVFTGRKVRGWPPDVGDCVVGQVEKIDPLIVDLVKNMCRDLKYQGIAEFEFKKDNITGKMFLIEINPRSWSWVGITFYCGLSLPWMAYCDTTGCEEIKYTEIDCPDGSVKYARISLDKINCLKRNKQAGYPQWHLTKSQWKQSLKCQTLVNAEFDRDDLYPWFVKKVKNLYFINLVQRVVNRIYRQFRGQC